MTLANDRPLAMSSDFAEVREGASVPTPCVSGEGNDSKATLPGGFSTPPNGQVGIAVRMSSMATGLELIFGAGKINRLLTW